MLTLRMGIAFHQAMLEVCSEFEQKIFTASSREFRLRKPQSDRTRGLCRALATAAAIEAFGMAHHVVETNAAERFSEFLLGG